jgi:hypothetical protein
VPKVMVQIEVREKDDLNVTFEMFQYKIRILSGSGLVICDFHKRIGDEEWN